MSLLPLRQCGFTFTHDDLNRCSVRLAAGPKSHVSRSNVVASVPVRVAVLFTDPYASAGERAGEWDAG